MATAGLLIGWHEWPSLLPSLMRSVAAERSVFSDWLSEQRQEPPPPGDRAGLGLRRSVLGWLPLNRNGTRRDLSLVALAATLLSWPNGLVQLQEVARCLPDGGHHVLNDLD